MEKRRHLRVNDAFEYLKYNQFNLDYGIPSLIKVNFYAYHNFSGVV